MNQTDLEIFEMYFQDGLREVEIARILGISEEAVNEVLAALEADRNIELQAEAEWRYEQTLDR
jgi:DNA-binding transcriptional regulator LsrR (DeoR family)